MAWRSPNPLPTPNTSRSLRSGISRFTHEKADHPHLPGPDQQVIALLYLSLLILTVPIGAIMLIFNKGNQNAFILMAIPVFYALAGFIFSVIGANLYNFIAKRSGGVEFTVTEIPDEPAS